MYTLSQQVKTVVERGGCWDEDPAGLYIGISELSPALDDTSVMLIVAISIRGENLLDFEEGYENLLDWLYDEYNIPECIVFWRRKEVAEK